MSYEKDILMHHGVKGQKWGVRKKSRVTLSEVPDNLIIKTRKKVSKKYRAEAAKYHLYYLRNSEGKKIGDLSLYDESKKSMNVVWVGVNPKHRGQGYATDAMRQVIDLANKNKKSQITLEVPGESPDAHHIYKKLGFKDDKKVSSDDDYWGGLTSMKKELKHMDTAFGQDSIEHHGVKGQKWGVRKYKEARSSGIKAAKMNQEAAVRRYKANERYIQNDNKMNEHAAKRDAIRNKLKSSEPNSKKYAKYAREMNKHDSKVKEYADKLKADEKDFYNADKVVGKYADAYESALKEAANQKVEIKKHTLGRALVMAALNMPYSPSQKDIFDENVMTYRSDHHVNHSETQTPDSIEHHGVRGMKWGQRKAASISNYFQTTNANKARAKQWRSQYNNRGSMSTEELRRAVNRLNLENQFDSATKQAMASSSNTVFSKYKQQYINSVMKDTVHTTNQVGNRVGQAAAMAMIKKLGTTAAASV